jgi:hypothetical protein
MDCQTSCQEEEFETCEYEIQADCSASCSGQGALFCDGEYVLSGDEIGPCVSALIARGIGELNFEGEVNAGAAGDATAGGGCQLASGSRLPFAFWSLGALGAVVLRRRRQCSGSARGGRS